jgi:hypothetical protein
MRVFGNLKKGGLRGRHRAAEFVWGRGGRGIDGGDFVGSDRGGGAEHYTGPYEKSRRCGCQSPQVKRFSHPREEMTCASAAACGHIAHDCDPPPARRGAAALVGAIARRRLASSRRRMSSAALVEWKRRGGGGRPCAHARFTSPPPSTSKAT